MATNWPPATPTWPPPGYSNLEASSYELAIEILQEVGAQVVDPTGSENRTYFRDARCDEGHAVTGKMVVWPNGTRYPFGLCNTQHSDGTRHGLVLWFPYEVHV